MIGRTFGLSTMGALTEVVPVRQVPGEPRRRWFASDELDLIVWSDHSGAPSAIQLCYNMPRTEHALTWKPDAGFLHAVVDDGENRGGKYKRTPLLVMDGHFDANRVSERFAQASALLPSDIAEFVSTKLRQHPSYVDFSCGSSTRMPAP